MASNQLTGVSPAPKGTLAERLLRLFTGEGRGGGLGGRRIVRDLGRKAIETLHGLPAIVVLLKGAPKGTLAERLLRRDPSDTRTRARAEVPAPKGTLAERLLRPVHH